MTLDETPGSASKAQHLQKATYSSSCKACLQLYFCSSQCLHNFQCIRRRY